MAPFSFNPLRAVLRYMRGDDIKEANAAAVARAQAALHAPSAPAPPTASAHPPTVDRRRM